MAVIYRRVIAQERTWASVVRRELDACLARQYPLDTGTAQAVLLVSGELVTNAVEHGCGAPVTVEAALHWPDLLLTVSQPCDGRGLPPVDAWVLPPSPRAMRGRGLAIVKALADSATVETGPSRSTVRVTMRLD